MKALVIAAGNGTRLRAISDSKPLTPVGGVPLIERVLAAVAEAGVRDVVVVTGHAADQVEAYLVTSAPRLGIDVACLRVPDWSLANGHSVAVGASAINDDFLLLMADHLFDPAIVRQLIALEARRDLMLAIDRNVGSEQIDLADATKVEVAPDGRIVRIGKSLTCFNAIDTGIFRATPALFEAIRADIADGGEGSLSSGVQRLADAGRAATHDVGEARWIDVDDPRNLAVAEAMFGRGAGIKDTAA
jgi:1L-myo-inositol 1-phosphate cytidylyltransferase